MQKKRNIQIVVKIALLLLLPALHHAQIVMGSGPADGSAQLELQSTDKGMLIPRLTTAQRDAIVSPAMGLMIYNTSTYCLEINVGTATSPQWGRMNCRTGVITTLNCGNTVVTGTLTSGQAASGVSASVPYTGGNSGVHTGQTVTSTGVTGLTATLGAGSFANGAGNLTYNITGTPTSGGTATFALNIGGQTCSLNVPVSYVCKAKIDATTYRDFMCHNLGAANTSADPFTPGWEINGGYWQWGRAAEAAAGPTGPGAGDTNEGAISGWNTSFSSNGSWADGSKTANDPCPTGYRVPTNSQWDNVIANNTLTTTGTYSNSTTNYSAGIKIGDYLMLPAAGFRADANGALSSRGSGGYYWSSTENGAVLAWYKYFVNNNAYIGTSNNVRSLGHSVRCIAELQGTLGALNCGSAVVTGTLNSGQAASGVSASVPYTGGNSGVHTGQTVTSTGVTGLTATLGAGSFANGAGNLTYTITGTPASGGTATFALNIGGQTCNLNVTVSYVCKAKIDATTYRDFMCYNLGAANTSVDPFTPGWEINGGYWQWGRATEAAAGPTGPGAGQANDGAISGWNTTPAADGSWTDGSKTGNDPCPTGFRVPTKSQWDGVLANNTQTNVGNFLSSATNYSTGKKFGNNLMLPATGNRGNVGGTLYNSGNSGFYWSSTDNGTNVAWDLYFNIGGAGADYEYRTSGLSIRCIAELQGTLGALNCGSAVVTGTLTSGQAASGVSASVSYTGGNEGVHTGQTVTSTGVTGLTATLAAGSFANGAGNLTYNITGTPASGGTATFALNIGGQTCNLNVTVSYVCKAKIDATTYRDFMCYNLGAANTSADPFTPSWEINGGYWQWGRAAEAAAGPTGPGAGQANDGAISGWNTTRAANGSWADGSKTGNDPCPTGFRVPTKAQWGGVDDNNIQTNVGTFSNSATNYGAGKKFGNNLMLPAAGYRYNVDGTLYNRGSYGYYWSSTEYGTYNAWHLYFLIDDADTYSGNVRTFGFSVRCIAE